MYNQDFYAWAMTNANLLREGRWTEIDAIHLVEELEAMGRSEKREFRNRLAILLAHMLKWRYQSAWRSKSWKYSIKEQQRKVAEVLEDSPSLQAMLDSLLESAYQDARLLAAKETGLDEETFPATCPYTLALAMDATWLTTQDPSRDS